MTTQSRDGGPAFPVTNHPSELVESTGMSLRDYFAAKAMPSAIAHELAIRGAQIAPGEFRYDSVAKAAYAMADAMLKARENKS